MKYSIGVAKEEIKNAVNQYFQKNEDGSYLINTWQTLPIFLIGPAGIGKTQIVNDVAKEMNLGFVSYSLVHHTRQTLMGLPVITNISDGRNEMKDTEYTLSELIGAVYKQIEQGYREGILFLDEANCCPETIQPMLLSFLQSKVLGSSKLPEGWMIILCGNPPKSVFNKNARAWDGALMDRLRVIELDLDHKEYLKYVYERAFHPVVAFYLATHLDQAYVCEQDADRMNLVTYRTWENLSYALYDYERMGLAVKPVMINQYIKVDQIVKDFYELYRYSALGENDYSIISKKLLDETVDIQVVRMLKEKPVSVLYGITNYCFKQLDGKAAELLDRHTYLKKLKERFYKKDFNFGEILCDEQMSGEMKADVERIWTNCSMDEVSSSLVELHDKYMKRLLEEKDVLLQRVGNLLLELEQIGNTVLVSYYVNVITKSPSWVYITSNGNSVALEKYKEFQQKYAA